jgi:hypothetical protein
MIHKSFSAEGNALVHSLRENLMSRGSGVSTIGWRSSALTDEIPGRDFGSPVLEEALTVSKE